MAFGAINLLDILNFKKKMTRTEYADIWWTIVTAESIFLQWTAQTYLLFTNM